MTLRGRYKYSDHYSGKLTSGGNVTGSESIAENRLENQVFIVEKNLGYIEHGGVCLECSIVKCKANTIVYNQLCGELV